MTTKKDAMISINRAIFLWKPFYLLCITISLISTQSMLKSIMSNEIRRKLPTMRRSSSNNTDINRISNRPSHTTQYSQRSVFTSRELSSFIERLPVNKEINCDEFSHAQTMTNDLKYHLYQHQKQTESFHYKNCSLLRRQGFNLPTSETELKHPIAFSVLAYRDPLQVTRLIRAIYRAHNVYCVHVDIKSNTETFNRLTRLSSCLQNVFVAPIRLNVKRSEFTALEPELLCMQILLRHRVRWKTWINLNGQEFPLKTNLELVSVLDLMNGASDVMLDNCAQDQGDGTQTQECDSGSPNGWMEKWPRNRGPTPYGVLPYRGSNHVILSREFVYFLMTSHPARTFLRWLRAGMGIPGEFFYSSIYHNKHLNAPGANRNRTYPKHSIARLRFRGRKEYKQCLKVVHGTCILSLQELPLLTSSHQLFASKFFQAFSPLGYSCLERWYFLKVYTQLTTGHVHLDLNFYRPIF